MSDLTFLDTNYGSPVTRTTLNTYKVLAVHVEANVVAVFPALHDPVLGQQLAPADVVRRLCRPNTDEINMRRYRVGNIKLHINSVSIQLT